MADADDPRKVNFVRMIYELHPRFFSGVGASYKETSYSGLVDTQRAAPSMFRLFEPLEYKLWLAIVASVMVAACIVVLIDVQSHRRRHQR